MGKPLLTDEVIAKAKEEANWETKLDLERETERVVQKSRRLENARRWAFQTKVNRIFFLVLVLILALIYAIFNL